MPSQTPQAIFIKPHSPITQGYGKTEHQVRKHRKKPGVLLSLRHGKSFKGDLQLP